MSFSSSAQVDLIIEGIDPLNTLFETSVRNPDDRLNARIITLKSMRLNNEKIDIIEYEDYVEVFFGTNLSEEYSTEINSIDNSLIEIQNLIQTVVQLGFTESVWLRDQKVLRTEAVLMTAMGTRRYRTRILAPTMGVDPQKRIHPAWN